MDTSTKYTVIFHGKIVSGENLEEVKRKLAALYKTDVSKIEQRFFSGKPFVIKANVDYQTAVKYQKSMEHAGAQCEVRKSVVASTKISTAKPPKTVEQVKTTQKVDSPEIVENTPSPQQKRFNVAFFKRFLLKLLAFLKFPFVWLSELRYKHTETKEKSSERIPETKSTQPIEEVLPSQRKRLTSKIAILLFKITVPKLGFIGKLFVLLLMILFGGSIYYKYFISLADFEALARIDPLPHTQQLVKEEKYAEADEYLSYFMDYDYVADNPKAVALHNEIKEKREGYFYKLGKITEGAVYGHSDAFAGQASAVVTDFLIIGDVRDLAIEGTHWWKDEEVDEFTVALSTIGVVATAGALVTAGATAIAKPVLSFFKMAGKIGKVPNWLRKYLIKSAKIVKETKSLDRVKDLFEAVHASYKAGGAKSTLTLLNKADDVNDFKKLSKVSNKFGDKTAVLIDIAGNSGFKTVNKLDNVPKNVVLEASTFGKEGIQKLDTAGLKRFQEFLNTTKVAARTTKVGWKHHEFIAVQTFQKGSRFFTHLAIRIYGCLWWFATH